MKRIHVSLTISKDPIFIGDKAEKFNYERYAKDLVELVDNPNVDIEYSFVEPPYSNHFEKFLTIEIEPFDWDAKDQIEFAKCLLDTTDSKYYD